MTIGPYKTPAKLQDQGYTTSLTIKTRMDQINKDKKRKGAYIAKVNIGLMIIYAI